VPLLAVIKPGENSPVFGKRACGLIDYAESPQSFTSRSNQWSTGIEMYPRFPGNKRIVHETFISLGIINDHDIGLKNGMRAASFFGIAAFINQYDPIASLERMAKTIKVSFA